MKSSILFIIIFQEVNNLSEIENNNKILVFNIFQRILNCIPVSIQKRFNDWHFKFKMDYKNPFSTTMTIKLSPYRNLLLQFNGGHPTIGDLKKKTKDIESKLNDYIPIKPVIDKDIFNLLTSWVMSQILDRIFYFSRQIWLNENTSPLESKEIQDKCNFLNILSTFHCSISRIWFYLLFEDIFPKLLSWINEYKVQFLEEYKIESSKKEIYDLMTEFGFPILISDTDLIFIRHFQLEEGMNFEKFGEYNPDTGGIIVLYPKWYGVLSKKIDEKDYTLRQSNFSTFREFKKKPEEYPRYHCIVFSKIWCYLFGDYSNLNAF